MPIESAGLNLLSTINPSFVVKGFLILFTIFYIVFSTILFRQIDLMSEKLPTSVNPLIRFIAIVNIGVSLALFFLILGIF